MNARKFLGLAAISLAALTLAACNSGSDDSPAPTTSDTAMTPPTAAPTTEAPADASGIGLMTADSSLGTIVTDSNGMVVYMYDSDTQNSGTSSCSDACLSSWPPVPAGSGEPELAGITGEVGSITGTDGNPQLTLNGWPLYYFASDTAAGDATGQGVGNVWWVLDADGNPVGK